MTGPGFARLAALLAADHTVVTYDPRGFGLSTIEDPEQDATPELTADDVRRVLEAVTDEPALVFGSSGGAVTGLALAVLHPERVRTVVAHEPPMIEMLPDAEQVRAQVRDVYDTYLAAGAGAAFGKFMAMAGFEVPEPDPASPPAPPSEQDQERMLAHSLLPVTSYRPGIAALKAAPSKVVIAGGATSSGQLAHRSASARRCVGRSTGRVSRRSRWFPGAGRRTGGFRARALPSSRRGLLTIRDHPASR